MGVERKDAELMGSVGNSLELKYVQERTNIYFVINCNIQYINHIQSIFCKWIIAVNDSGLFILMLVSKILENPVTQNKRKKGFHELRIKRINPDSYREN